MGGENPELTAVFPVDLQTTCPLWKDIANIFVGGYESHTEP